MSDAAGFAHEIAHDDDLLLVDEVAVSAWFLCETQSITTVALDDALAFLKEWGVRTSINKHRVKSALRKNRQASLKANDEISIPLKIASLFKEKYASFLNSPVAEIEDSLLVASEFEKSRKYIIAIVRQINGSYQFEFYDAAATMMRRLAEVLIIDAYEAVGQGDEIRDSRDGHYVMMNGLINALTSGKTFKLSRNAPKQLETLKLLGDNAAHSRTHLTRKKDLDDFAHAYRMLISELKTLE